MQAYDLIVIGSGPGGQRAAIQAAKSGKKVLVVEKRASVGGVCTNTGTIPSKTMREAVLHLSGFYYQNFYGANYHVKDVVTMADLNYRVQRVIENEVAVIQDQLQRNGGGGVYGKGKFFYAHRGEGGKRGGGAKTLGGKNFFFAGAQTPGKAKKAS